MAGQRRIGEVLWTALLLLWGLALFFAVGLIGAVRSLGCDEGCARGEDWGWLALGISSLLGLISMLLFVLLSWLLKGRRRRFLAFASVAMLVASIVGVVALLSLDDGRGA
ncbi:hypothetical protein KBX37_30365 [Micromonospora sp. U56]|uniref:hypothetical protein n=1 Tax=Micromonospora sp. U56 TaxID=2824900 RepID=UPI001B39A0F2|nr:hypothetical protein [Micromonospora sp. U56]MBQ0897319.1 hypothetical protein [Micromonospora sp. U56]